MFEVATPEENEAVEALRRQGHETITTDMVDEWIAARHKAGSLPQQFEPETSWTNYRPAISDDAANPDAQTARRRKRGRPAKNDLWIPLAAQYVAEGLTLRKALGRLGLLLSLAERKNVYRLKLFREALQRERERLEME